MLSFEIINSGTAIQIHYDAEGMSVLLGALAKLIGEHASHCYLRAPSYGGSALSDTTPWGKPAVDEVIVDYAESGSS